MHIIETDHICGLCSTLESNSQDDLKIICSSWKILTQYSRKDLCKDFHQLARHKPNGPGVFFHIFIVPSSLAVA